MALLNMETNTELQVLQCGNCGVWHAIPQAMYDSCEEEGGYWRCPNEHSRGFSEGSLRNKLKKEKKRREWAEQNAKSIQIELDETERRRVAQKAATTRLQKRAKAGVCPCCNRTFKQLATHMKNKHPKFETTG